MLQAAERMAVNFKAGAFASIFAHAIVVALFVFDLPQLTEPENHDAIEVELVPPKERVAETAKTLTLPDRAMPKPAQPKPEQKSEPAAKPTPKTTPPKLERDAKPRAKPMQEMEKTDSAAPEKTATPLMQRPVYKFGEKDAGSTKPVNGDAERETEVASARPAEKPAEKRHEIPQAVIAPDGLEAHPPSLAAPTPKSAPPERAKSQSRSEDQSPVATTAIGKEPRAVRAGRLCVSELRRQMTTSNPPFWPDLLPTYRLDKGNVLQVRQGAFRANARWYNLEFRCEIDEAATSVVSLSFDIGVPVPRDEWTRRGFPAL
jgi:hypothetical protein